MSKRGFGEKVAKVGWGSIQLDGGIKVVTNKAFQFFFPTLRMEHLTDAYAGKEDAATTHAVQTTFPWPNLSVGIATSLHSDC